MLLLFISLFSSYGLCSVRALLGTVSVQFSKLIPWAIMSLGTYHRVRGSTTLFCSIVLQEAVSGITREMECSTHCWLPAIHFQRVMEWQELIKAVIYKLMPRGAIRGQAIHLPYFMVDVLFNEKLRGKLCPPLAKGWAWSGGSTPILPIS